MRLPISPPARGVERTADASKGLLVYRLATATERALAIATARGMENRRRWASITTRTFRSPRWLCPPHAAPAVVAIYRFARTADDIADEGDATPAQRLADLAALPRRSARGRRRRGGLAALAAGLRAARPGASTRIACPSPLLADLLDAFAQDVVQTRYADRAELLDYCRRSANPVGRLLLHLYDVDDADALAQSDAICTALQLTNFWQDLGVDAARGRALRAAGRCARHGVEVADARCSGATATAWRALVARARGLGARADAAGRAARRTRSPAAPAGSCASSCRAGCASSRRSTASAARRCSAGRRSARRTRRCSPGAPCDAPCRPRAGPPRGGAPRRSVEAADVTPEQYGQQKAAPSGSSFYYASCSCRRRGARRSPRSTRSAARSTTSSTRSRDPGVAATKLAWWRSEVGAAFAGKPSHPAMQRAAAARGRLRHRAARICWPSSTAWQMDLDQSRYLDFAGLARYCHLVAGVVGEVAANIFGCTDWTRPSTTRTGSASRSSSPTSSATSATTRGAAASTCR